jgi:hypothetical protein
MEAAGFAKIFVLSHEATWHYILEDCTLNTIYLVEKCPLWKPKLIALLTVLFTPSQSIQLKFL